MENFIKIANCSIYQLVFYQDNVAYNKGLAVLFQAEKNVHRILGYFSSSF